MTRIPVDLAGNGYDILVESGALNTIADHLEPHLKNNRAFVITDSNVAAKWLEPLQMNLQNSGIKVISHVLPAGEQTKSWKVLEQLTDWLLDNGTERSDTLIALGGGVIGDLTGFTASILKRGCRFIQIPTSLLAQVDSSVGGKTAINSRAGKNLIGRFNQPQFVLIDPLVLGTLSDRELRAGYAEVVKYGLINNAPFFDWCEENGSALLNRDPEALSYAISQSVQAKAGIVADDEKELSGRRALLNLGHTFGHALEAETGYSSKLVHGEGVAAGMALAFHYSERRGHCGAADARRVAAHLKDSGLPYSLKSASIDASGEQLVQHMLHDKKMTAGNLPFLLANGIGQTFLADDVELKDVAMFLDQAE
ncbi:3-dehydroquinate synthase [Parasphingorhabdus cellanae]|uniref:3-dehydroquinate synthase n=1 Tax=Parasphingorhabdus cellanae TaxID=2806553 RepID=A0ABX7T9Q5_9SPHN|nr:3-dehydroquinate synthase [Parasphingorhabdus cellanae]QTD57105.1 3-dehydroquinate synthase [Parasphingorhabdus cellanae]